MIRRWYSVLRFKSLTTIPPDTPHVIVAKKVFILSDYKTRPCEQQQILVQLERGAGSSFLYGTLLHASVKIISPWTGVLAVHS